MFSMKKGNQPKIKAYKIYYHTTTLYTLLMLYFYMLYMKNKNFVNIFCYFVNISPWYTYIALYLNKIKSVSPKDGLHEVWFKLPSSLREKDF